MICCTFCTKYLVLGRASICFNYSLNSPRHTIDQIFDSMYRNFPPCLLNMSVKFSHVGRQFFPFTNVFLDISPQIFNWIEVWTLSGPQKYAQIVFRMKLLCKFCFVGASIILLEYTVTIWKCTSHSWHNVLVKDGDMCSTICCSK